MQVTISRSGRMFDSQVEGNEFYSSENIFCTSGPSLRRHFSRFTEVKFISSDSSDVRSTDQSLIVSSGVSDSYGYFVKSDVTYEILAVSSSNWKWRKWAAGMFPSGSLRRDSFLTTESFWNTGSLSHLLRQVKLRMTFGVLMLSQKVHMSPRKISFERSHCLSSVHLIPLLRCQPRIGRFSARGKISCRRQLFLWSYLHR